MYTGCLLIQECHSNPTGGHLGRSKMTGKIKNRYYWPNQYVDVDNLVSRHGEVSLCTILHYLNLFRSSTVKDASD